MGLGNFSANGDSRSGQVLVAAAPLGDASTLNTVGSQRYKLKQAVANLTAGGSTPSAHAYAEAAAYLMGTTTYSEANYAIRKDSYIKRVRKSDNRTEYFIVRIIAIHKSILQIYGNLVVLITIGVTGQLLIRVWMRQLLMILRRIGPILILITTPLLIML